MSPAEWRTSARLEATLSVTTGKPPYDIYMFICGLYMVYLYRVYIWSIVTNMVNSSIWYDMVGGIPIYPSETHEFVNWNDDIPD